MRHCFRLKKGDDLLLAIQAYARKYQIKAAVPLACVGSLYRWRLRGTDGKSLFDGGGIAQIISLGGTISENGTHLHISLSRENLCVVGGHLVEGCIVGSTAEIVLDELEDTVFLRTIDAETGNCELEAFRNECELWDLYTADRTPTGRTHRRGDPMPPGLYNVVVEVWIRGADGRFLVSQRHPDKTYPCLWECTGGSAISGEDSLQAALREVYEELGLPLDAKNGQLLRSEQVPAKQYFRDIWLFTADAALSTLKLQPDEVIAAKWVTYEELCRIEEMGMLVPPVAYFRELFAE